MFKLLQSELSRYQKWAWLWCVVLLGVFSFIHKQKPFLEYNFGQTALTNLLLIGACFLFGILQMALHKRKNNWTYLIHRPLKPLHIYLGLLGAAVLIIFIAIILPWLIMTSSLDVFTNFVVDTRHYAYVIFLFLTCLMVLQLGNLVVLSASWGVILLSMLVVVVLAPVAKSHITQFLPLVCFNIVLFYLNVKSFKPDLSTHLTAPAAIAFLSIPMSFGIGYLLLMSTSIFYHIPLYMTGTHPDVNPKETTLRYIYETSDKQYLNFALLNTNTDNAKSIAAQGELAESFWLSTTAKKFPRKDQLYVDDRTSVIRDNANKISYYFSHDEMVFIGTSRLSSKAIKMIGKNGFIDGTSAIRDEDRFDYVPHSLPQNQYMSPSTIYDVSFESNLIRPIFTLPEGEVFINQVRNEKAYVSISTDKRIILFSAAEYNDDYADVSPLISLPHPIDYRDFSATIAYELADGFAVLYFSNNYFGFEKSGLQVFKAGYDDSFELIGERRFTDYPHPVWIRQFDFMMSPSLYVARSAVFDWIAPESVALISLREIKNAKFDSKVLIVASIIHVLSIAAVLWLSILYKLAFAQRATWFVLVSIFGFPIMLTFFLLNPFKNAPFKVAKVELTNL